MKKKTKYIIFSIIIIFAFNIFSFNANISNAVYTVDSGGGVTTTFESKIDPDNYDPTGKIESGEETAIFAKAGIILGAIRNIGVVVAVLALMIIGVKYMLGSVEEKANYKATMMPYVIGLVMAVAGTTLVTFIYNAIK